MNGRQRTSMPLWLRSLGRTLDQKKKKASEWDVSSESGWDKSEQTPPSGTPESEARALDEYLKISNLFLFLFIFFLGKYFSQIIFYSDPKII